MDEDRGDSECSFENKENDVKHVMLMPVVINDIDQYDNNVILIDDMDGDDDDHVKNDDDDDKCDKQMEGVAPLEEQSKAANWFGQASIYRDEIHNDDIP